MQASGGGHRESAPALLAGYEGLLAHLKTHGALLNSVKPEMLLDLADFRSAVLLFTLAEHSHALYIAVSRCTAAARSLRFIHVDYTFCCFDTASIEQSPT